MLCAGAFNCLSTNTNTLWRSPYDLLFLRPPKLQAVRFFQPGMVSLTRLAKSDAQNVPWLLLNNGHNHFTSTIDVIQATAGGVCYTS